MSNQPQVLMIGHYPLDNLDRAPKVRIFHLAQALQQQVSLKLISDYRKVRRRVLWQLIISGDLYKYDFVYIEAATSTAMDIDLLLLILWRIHKCPVGIFIRDAHPLFNMTPSQGLKNKLLLLGWHISQWAYHHLANVLFYPTAGLRSQFSSPHPKEILPPGCASHVVAVTQGESYILYAGGLSHSKGSSLLYQTMQAVRKVYPVKLLVVCSPEQEESESDWLTEEWVEVSHNSLQETALTNKEIAMGIIPLTLTPYYHLALPVKLMDYLALGLPVVSTACQEIVQFMETYPVGITALDQPEAMSQAVLELLQDKTRRAQMAQMAYQLAQGKLSWNTRAKELIRTMQGLAK